MHGSHGTATTGFLEKGNLFEQMKGWVSLGGSEAVPGGRQGNERRSRLV
jgi:hypothetical protein